MDQASRVRTILSRRGLSLHSVSQKSAEIFGRSSDFYIPHNLFSGSGSAMKAPTISQVLSLSRISGYRLPDWLTIFGFDLDRILSLQLLIPRRRTVVLDSTIYDPQRWIPWFMDRARHEAQLPSVAPLSRLLVAASVRRAAELLASTEGQFLYALVGEEDVHAMPHFVPGSIVRADTRRCKDLSNDANASQATFFLVEHEQGWTCSRLFALGKNRVLLHCPQRPFAECELRIGKNARILGAIDAEIRPMLPRQPSSLSRQRAHRSAAKRGILLADEPSLKDLLRQSRAGTGLSFREASAASRWIAEQLGDRRYFAAASTLSDYETLYKPPSQIQKVITLCLLYSIRPEQLFLAGRLPFHSAGREPIPEDLAGSASPFAKTPEELAAGSDDRRTANGFLESLLEQWKEIPLFLRCSLDKITGMKNVTLSDLFWVGGERSPRHPLLTNASLVAVNRRMRKIVPGKSNRCDRPLYLVLTRGGNYFCGPCSLEGGTLVLDGYARAGVSTERFRMGVDAEVAARVTAILRRFA